MRPLLPVMVATLALVACVDAENEDTYMRRDGSIDTAGSTKDTGGADGPKADSTLTDTGGKGDTASADTGDPDTGDPDTGDPDTGDPDTGSFDAGLPDIGGGKCMYCSSGTCPTLLVDYSCFLDCLIDGYSDCIYTFGASKPCKCLF